MTEMKGSTPEQTAAEEAGPGAEVDRTALAALVREVTATHFVVWAVSDSGGLQSTKIRVSDVAQQIAGAVRILDRNFDQAMQMLVAASNAFDATVQRWEAQVRQSEQKLRANRNAGKLNQVKGQHNQIRTRVAPTKSVFRRVILMFQETDSRYRRQASGLSPNAGDVADQA